MPFSSVANAFKIFPLAHLKIGIGRGYFVGAKDMVMEAFYWMLECKQCGSRRVVRDIYWEDITPPNADEFDSQYGGSPLPERYSCNCGRTQRYEVVGRIVHPGSDKFLPGDPYVEGKVVIPLSEIVKLDADQIEEWTTLINRLKH